MLMNNLDPDVAERPDDLVVYGGTGKAARDWPSFDRIVATLRTLGDDETLLVQSGKPVAVFRSHPDAPRVLIANSNLVGKWATWDHFRELERQGLMMYGQMTAGSWIYIGTQGILQGTYETFVAAGRTHFGSGDLAGRVILTGGLGGMGGAQPLAATMAGAVMLAIDVDPHRIRRRLETKYLDEVATDLDDALARVARYAAAKTARSVGLLGNCAEVLPELVRRGFRPDLVTDQTSRPRSAQRLRARGSDPRGGRALRAATPWPTSSGPSGRWPTTSARWSRSSAGGPTCSTTATTSARWPSRAAAPRRRVLVPGVRAGVHPAAVLRGQGPVPLGGAVGRPRGHRGDRPRAGRAVPRRRRPLRWLKLAAEKVRFQGLPARICWLGYGDRQRRAGVQRLVREGKVKAPIVIGRDHLDCGSVASPNRETEAMKDGTDAVADWPILNAMINAVNGASWVSFHHGGGVGIGLLAARGDGHRGRRHRRRPAPRPGAGLGPRDGRRPPRGRRLRRAIEVARERGVAIPGLTR
jgi:urocanate hydratase